MAIVEVQDIHTYYGDAYVLQGLSLELEQGQILVALGVCGIHAAGHQGETQQAGGQKGCWLCDVLFVHEAELHSIKAGLVFGQQDRPTEAPAMLAVLRR